MCPALAVSVVTLDVGAGAGCPMDTLVLESSKQ